MELKKVTMKHAGKKFSMNVGNNFIITGYFASQFNTALVILTHCGLVMPYGHIDLGQHWLK